MLSKGFTFQEFGDGSRINLDSLKPELLNIIYKAVKLINESQSAECCDTEKEIQQITSGEVVKKE
jgi:hypothetical protein